MKFKVEISTGQRLRVLVNARSVCAVTEVRGQGMPPEEGVSNDERP